MKAHIASSVFLVLLTLGLAACVPTPAISTGEVQTPSGATDRAHSNCERRSCDDRDPAG